MKHHRGIPLFLMLALTGTAALAEGPDEGPGRYSLSPVEGGVLRLDKENGAVAFCARKGEQWSCEPVEDKAKSVAERIAKLEEENKALKDHIATMEAAQAPPADSGPPGGKLQVPTEEEVDKALDYVERMFKKFRDRLQKLDPPKADAPPREGQL